MFKGQSLKQKGVETKTEPEAQRCSVFDVWGWIADRLQWQIFVFYDRTTYY